MAFAGLFVVIHQVYDQPIVIEQVVDNQKKDDDRRGQKVRKVDATGNIIVEEGEEGTTTGTGTAKGGSLAGHGVVQLTETPGTIVFYVIIGIAGVALLLYLLAVHRNPSTITFAVVVVKKNMMRIVRNTQPKLIFNYLLLINTFKLVAQ